MRRQKHIFMLLKQALKSVKTITVQEDRNRFYVSKTGLEVCKKTITLQEDRNRFYVSKTGPESGKSKYEFYFTKALS